MYTIVGKPRSPNFDEKLKILESANIQFLANGPRLQSSMPRANTSLARQLADSFEAKVPAEALSSPTYNDRLLDRLLHHRLSHVDFTLPRRDSIYNEGRSYHHSFKPDIERTIRRLHIFTQQTEDYPNLYGTTLFLDTRWQGVRSGFGTPTDMHVGKRNLALKDVLDKKEIKALPEEIATYSQPRSEGLPLEQSGRPVDLISPTRTKPNKRTSIPFTKKPQGTDQAHRPNFGRRICPGSTLAKAVSLISC